MTLPRSATLARLDRTRSVRRAHRFRPQPVLYNGTPIGPVTPLGRCSCGWPGPGEVTSEAAWIGHVGGKARIAEARRGKAGRT